MVFWGDPDGSFIFGDGKIKRKRRKEGERMRNGSYEVGNDGVDDRGGLGVCGEEG